MKSKLLLVILISFFLAQCLLLNYFIPLFFLLIGLFVWLMFFYPEVSLLITFLVFVNFFSLVNDNLLRVPGILKARDVIFIILFIPMIIDLVSQRQDDRYPSKIKYAMYILIFLFVLEICLSMIRGETFLFAFKEGRRYLYYLLCFQVYFLVNNQNKVKNLIKMLIYASLIFSGLKIGQYFLGQKVVLFLGATRVVEQNLSGKIVTRSYVMGKSIAIFFSYYFLFSLLKRYGGSIINAVCFFVLAFCGVYLSFSRANWFGYLCGVIFTLFIFRERIKVNKIILISILIIVTSTIIFAVQAGKTSENNPAVFAIKHMFSAFEDIANRQGTFAYRLKDSASRIELAKHNIIAGVGFIHPESGMFRLNTLTEGVTTSDSGILTLILEYGLLGVAWLFVLTSIIYSECRKNIVFLKGQNEIFVFSTFAFFFSRLFSFITLADFVMVEGIVFLAFIFGLFARITGDQNDRIINNNS